MAPAPSAKTERLMNLVMTLLATRRTLTRHDLRNTVEQYRLAPSDEAFERMFERDKEELRALGIPIETVETHDQVFEDELGYRIRPDEYVLPEIAFEPDELTVLGLAARTWSHGSLGGAAALALRKLQATQPGSDGSLAGPLEPRLGASEPAFPAILRALQALQEIHFDYRAAGTSDPTRRRVQPWGLTSVRGHWYLTALDLDRAAERVFRLSRIVGAVRAQGRPGSYTIPADARPAEVAQAAAGPESPVTAQLTLRDGSGARLRRRSEMIDEMVGWSRIRVKALGAEDLVSELAMLLDSVRDIAPAEVAEAVAAHLQSVLRAHATGIGELGQEADAALDTARRIRGSRRHGTIEPATARLSRLLAMVPWLVHRQGIDLDEAAAGLGVTEDQLRSDLALLFMCGYGSMPDELIEVDAEDGRIFIHNAETIARPLRLGWDEAVTLVVGLRALESVPGLHTNDAVARALEKIEAAAGDLLTTADRVTARIDEDVDNDLLATLRSALHANRRVHLIYEGGQRDDRTERDVDLMRVVSTDGRWYAEGWCHRARDTRFFRLDRIRSVTLLDVAGTPPPDATTRDLAAGTYQPSDDAVTVTLALQPSARWVTEYYPIEEQADVESADGTIVVVQLKVSHPDWLIRLVVGLGGQAAVLTPADLREALLQRTRDALGVAWADGSDQGGPTVD